MEQTFWQQVEEAFHQAHGLPPKERTRYLSTLPTNDLRVEVESLLQSSFATDDPVDTVVGKALVQAVAEGTTQQNFGPYRVCQWLGGGSHSDVYLAERTDGEYRSQVAVKVAKRGLPTEDLRHRFRQERQILASLNHPNIARLLDGGTTDDGLPFFVMEYIAGEPIDQYCDQQRLSISQRLRLFVTVCSAVEHAHRNLIIHRDLKPSNILVTADGQPILLDFGIAKLLQTPMAADQAIETVQGLRFFTPAYASPEQILGRSLTTATDVYSLGIILYQLLCGHAPYEIEGLEPKALYDTICETQPAAPSRSFTRSATPSRNTPSRNSKVDGVQGNDTLNKTALARSDTARGLRKRLRGDLDTIVLMALRKEPNRRYPSVAALAEDLDHHLRHLPIRGRPETLDYRFAKLRRRHPYGVAATTALIVAVAVGLFSTWRATWQAQQQRDQAQASQAEAERVTDFMVGLFGVSSPEISLGEPVSAVVILNRGAELIVDQLGEQPLSRARLLSAMGRSYQGLGHYTKAEDLLRQSIDDRRRALGENHLEVADGFVDLAKSALAAGTPAKAQDYLQHSLKIYTAMGPLGNLGKATAESLQAEILLKNGEAFQAEALYRQVFELRTTQLGPQHLDTLQSLSDLAETLAHLQHSAEALDLFEQVLEGQRRHLSDAHPDIVKTLSNLAIMRQRIGDLEEAESAMREVVEARRRLYGESHPHVALAYNNLGQILSLQGKHEAAIDWLEQALALSLKLYDEEHPRIADLRYSLGLVQLKLGRLVEAEEQLTHSLVMRRRALGEEHPAVAQSLLTLSVVHHQQQEFDRAIKRARQSDQILAAALPEGDFRRSSSQLQLGLLLAETKRCSEASPLLEKALTIQRKSLPVNHPALKRASEAQERCQGSTVINGN